MDHEFRWIMNFWDVFLALGLIPTGIVGYKYVAIELEKLKRKLLEEKGKTRTIEQMLNVERLQSEVQYAAIIRKFQHDQLALMSASAPLLDVPELPQQKTPKMSEEQESFYNDRCQSYYVNLCTTLRLDFHEFRKYALVHGCNLTAAKRALAHTLFTQWIEDKGAVDVKIEPFQLPTDIPVAR